jgi:hypothetical protein
MPTASKMTAELESNPAPRKRLVGCGYLLVGLSVAGLIGLAGVWYYVSTQLDERLAVQVAKVRARGEPLTTAELNDFYQPAQIRPDMTQEIMAALAICDAPALKPLAAKLPIVGQGPEPTLPPQDWSELEEVESFLSQQTSALETFRDVARRSGTARFPVDFTAGIATLLPQAQSMRPAARVLSLQFYVDLHRGRTSDAVECLLGQLALAGALDQEPILISQLVRIAIVSVAAHHVQHLLGMPDVSDADLVRLQQALRKLECQSCLKHAMAGERAIGYSVCVDAWLSDGSTTMTPAQARQLSSRSPKRVADAAKILELNLRITEAAEKSLFAALQAGAEAEAEMAALRAGLWNRISYAMTMLVSPAYRQALTAFARMSAKRDFTDAALAAELFRRRQGRWPETLDELVPDFLPRVPLDAFTDQPLKMTSTADEFKVYSVGSDGKDDNGNLSDRDAPSTDVGIVVPWHRGD